MREIKHTKILNLSKSLPTFTICHPSAFIFIGFFLFLSLKGKVSWILSKRSNRPLCPGEGSSHESFPQALDKHDSSDTFLFLLLIIEASLVSLLITPWSNTTLPRFYSPQTQTLWLCVLGPGTAGCQDCAALQYSCSSVSGNPAPSVPIDLWDLQVKCSPSSRGARLLPSGLGTFISFEMAGSAFSKATSRSASEQETCAADKGGRNRSLSSRADCFPRSACTLDAWT